MKIFLDIDGVLADWCKAAHRLNNIEYPGTNSWPYTRGPSGWDWGPQAGIEYGWHLMGRKFWKELDWLEDGIDILQCCQISVPPDNLCLLTSFATIAEGAFNGRMDWLKENMPGYDKRLLVGLCKEMCASANTILVDDYDKNIDKWVAAGGIGMLLPRPWNSNEHYAHDATGYLFERLKRIMETN